MQNWDRVLELSEESANSAGMQSLMHAKAMESVESQVQKLTVAWQEFTTKLITNDAWNTTIKSLTGLLNIINKTADKASILGVVLQGVGLAASKYIGMGIAKIGSSLGSGFASMKNIFTTNPLRSFKKASGGSYEEYSKDLKKLSEETAKYDDELEKLNESIMSEEKSLEELGPEIDEINYKKQVAQEKAAEITKKINAEEDSYKSLSVGLIAAANGFNIMATSSSAAIRGIGIIGSSFTNVAQVALSATKAVNSFGQAQKSVGAAKTAAIGMGFSAALTAIVAGIEIIKRLYDWLNVTDEELADSANNVASALDKYNNATTQLKSAEKTLKTYQDLAQQLYRTTAEQEKLNEAAQSLGDAFNIEVITDAYGNLSVSINAVNQALESLKREQLEARDALLKTEKDEYDKYDTNGYLDEYTEATLTKNRAKYQTALGDFYDVDMTKQNATTIKQISSDLKDTILNDTTEIMNATGKLKNQSIYENAAENMEGFKEKLSQDNWEQLGQIVDNISNLKDDTSVGSVFTIIDNQVARIGEDAKLTNKEIEQLKKSVKGTIYGNDIVSNIGQAKKNSIKLYDSKGQLKTVFGDDEEKLKRYRMLQLNINRWQNMIDNGGRGVTSNRKEALKDQIERAKTQMEDLGVVSEETQIKLENSEKLVKSLSGSTLTYLTQVKAFDAENTDAIAEIGKNQWNSINEAFNRSSKEGVNAYLDALRSIMDDPTTSDEVRRQAEEMFNKAFNNIEISATMNWTNVSDNLKTITEDLRSMNDIVDSINENGGLNLDEFADFGKLLYSMDFNALANAGEAMNVDLVGQYVDAMSKLKFAYNDVTGAIEVNGEATKELQNIEEIMAKARIQQAIDQIDMDNAELDAKILTAQAEIETNKQMITWLKGQKETKVKLSEYENQANKVYAENMSKVTDSVLQMYKSMTDGNVQWAEASIANAVKVGEAIKRAMAGDTSQGNLQQLFAQLKKDFTAQNMASWQGIELTANDKGILDINKAIASLNDSNSMLQKSITNWETQKKSLGAMRGLYTDMLNSSLGALGSNLSEANKKLDEYIGKLKEIYNIQNRILVLENRLKNIEDMDDVSNASQYATFYKERVDKTAELIDQYKFLTSEQKKFTNGMKEYIDASSVGHVFDFDEYGQIIINFEEYNKLSTIATDNMKSQKEIADDLYDTYTEMYEELNKDLDKTIEYLEKQIELLQEALDDYQDIEEAAAEAIKDIYQEVLDKKLDAIDKEIEALNDLKAARDKANKDKENAEKVSDIQTSMQRALMDTSGASDTAFLKAQDELTNQLEKMAEDKYSEDLENIIELLNEEKNTLQDEFEELFANMRWLYQDIQQDLMDNPEEIINLLEGTEAFKTMSPEAQTKQFQEWAQKIEVYSTQIDGGKSIKDVWDTLEGYKAEVHNIDEILRTLDSKIGLQVANAIANQYKNSSSGSSGGGSGNTSSYTPTYTPTRSSTNTYTKASIGAYNVPLSSDRQYGTFNGGVDDNGVYYQPNNVGGDFLTSTKFTGASAGIDKNSSGYNIRGQTVWVSKIGKQLYMWNGTIGKYETVGALRNLPANSQYDMYEDFMAAVKKNGWKYASGGFANFTGPAWLDGTKQKPEAVLNPLQTEHFIQLTNSLDKIATQGGASIGGSITIDTISFNVDSMSSAADGEKAFDAFVAKFNEIGSRNGLRLR